jgi:hypothetical protein
LIEELGVGDYEVQDLLDKDFFDGIEKLLSSPASKITLLAFRAHCEREMRSPQALSPVSPVAVIPSNLFCV